MLEGLIGAAAGAALMLGSVEAHRRWRVPRLSLPARELCQVRTVQYEDGTIDERHSRCRGVHFDLDQMLNGREAVIKDTAHVMPPEPLLHVAH